MQNIPGISLEKAVDTYTTGQYSTAKKGDQHTLFADLFDQHSTRIEEELSLAPVSNTEKMLNATPKVAEEKRSVNAANTKAPVKEDKKEAEVVHERNERMTEDDFNKVKDDLKEYGLSEKEISALEEKVKSDEGLTWGQFVSGLSQAMAAMRTNQLSDDQKDKLGTFFSKFGFTSEESDKLVSRLENGEQDKVMAALQAKLNAMPEGQQLLLTKEGVEAFSVAMGFSKEFSSKMKEMIGQNTMSKDVKEAFTLIRQEMAALDAKDIKLVKAVGEAFAAAVGDKTKESTVANEIKESVDLKPRVAEGEIKAEVKEEFKEAVVERKESLADTRAKANTETNILKVGQKATPDKDVMNQDVADEKSNAQKESNDAWNNFFGKLHDESESGSKTLIKGESADQALKSALANASATASSKAAPQAWEKVSAPKVLRQVENAFLKNLSNGTKQLTVELTPENLGKLNIVLQVEGKEVNAMIRAESADAAKVISENLDIIKNALENQGLKVQKLEVQAGLTGGQGQQTWSGQEQHNMARDREIMSAMRNHMKNLRGVGAGLAQDMQSVSGQAIRADQGLHVIA